MARWTKWTSKKEQQFLDHLREGHTAKAACALIGCPRSTAYKRKDTDPAFSAAWDDARAEGAEVLEEEAFRRAVSGIERTYYDKDGKPTSIERQYSDTLLIFLMKGAMPEKYKDRVQQDVSGDLVIRVEYDDDIGSQDT